MSSSATGGLLILVMSHCIAMLAALGFGVGFHDFIEGDGLVTPRFVGTGLAPVFEDCAVVT